MCQPGPWLNVDGSITNEQLPSSRLTPALPAPTSLLGHPGMTQCGDLCISHVLEAPSGHAWELVLGVGARSSCWQNHGPVCACTCVSGGWHPGLARCPKLIVGFNSDGGGGAGVTDETLTG